jgi:hypothetical protein
MVQQEGNMPARHKLASWIAALLFGASILAALGQNQAPSAQTQDADGGDEPDRIEAEGATFEAPVVGPSGPQRFAPASGGGPEAVAFDDLSGAEQEATDQAAELLEAGQPKSSVAGWSAIAREHAEKAALRRAEYEAGVSGDVGVE